MECKLKAFKLEGIKYRQMLKEAREVKIAQKVKECRKDVKKSNLTCRKIVTSFPDSESDEMLANQFSDYFMEKIRAIRDRLEEHPIYNPHDTAKSIHE